MTRLNHLNTGLYDGFGTGAGCISPSEIAMHKANADRMRALYPGDLYDLLIQMQRRGFVVVRGPRPGTLRVDGNLVSEAKFRKMAARERRLMTEPKKKGPATGDPQPAQEPTVSVASGVVREERGAVSAGEQARPIADTAPGISGVV